MKSLVRKILLFFKLKNYDTYYLTGFLLVFTAGTVLSFGAVIVRHMVDANLYQPQYLFYRGISIAVILLFYLLSRERLNFYKNFKSQRSSGFLFCNKYETF